MALLSIFLLSNDTENHAGHGGTHSVPYIKNPKARMTKFQLEQALHKDKVSEIMPMTKVYSYGSLEHLSSRDFIFEIGQTINELDARLDEFHKKRFDSQEIAEEFENSSFKYDYEVLAHHWLRSGDVIRGCNLLQSAAEKA